MPLALIFNSALTIHHVWSNVDNHPYGCLVVILAVGSVVSLVLNAIIALF